MRMIKNLKVGVKIISGYVIALILLGIVGGIALIRTNEINNTVDGLVNNLGPGVMLADKIPPQIVYVRFYAIRYILGGDTADLNKYYDQLDKLDGILSEADVEIQNAERVALLSEIKDDFDTYQSDFEEIRAAIEERDRIRAEVLDVVGPQAEEHLRELRSSAYQAQDIDASTYAGDAQAALILMRLNAFKYLQTGDESLIALFEERYAQAQAAFVSLDEELENPERRALAEEAAALVDEYAFDFALLHNEFKIQNEKLANLNIVGPEIAASAVDITESYNLDFTAAGTLTEDTVASTRTLLIILIIVSVVVGLGLGLAITQMITKPLTQVTALAEQVAETDLKAIAMEMGLLAKGDLTRSLKITAKKVDVDSKDEVGQMAVAFNNIIGRLNETGDSFGVMVTNLRDLVSRIIENAEQVQSASGQLAVASEQAGEVTGQIAVTIQQVAAGNQEQTSSIVRTNTTIEHLSGAIDSVAKGAQEQAGAINRASALTGELNASILQVSGNAKRVTDESATASESAQKGTEKVKDTITGMEAIRDKVSAAERSVTEMGARSEEIGAIVATIEDIASQTNLLALNAAIEAARAGEHGKGFAVVADEVRKLAERAASATGEIGGLIKKIQTIITEAVSAMRSGTEEVKNGVAKANEAGSALEDILRASTSVYELAIRTSAASDEMSSSAHKLVDAIETVSVVVEENTAASEEMAASSSEVTQAMEGIAAISEENSASVEEVSASTEEMNAQVEEVNASAQELADMSMKLQEAVSLFKL